MTRNQKKREPSKPLEVLVVGGGSFGTAISTILAEHDHRVKIWVRSKEQADEINNNHTNERYHPGIKLSEKLLATNNLGASIPGTHIIIVGVPSKAFRQVAKKIGDYMEGDQIVVHITKGIERGTFKRMSEILREETCALKIGAISGPNLAKEIMAGHPAGALVASHYDEVIRETQALFSGGRFRLYGGHDVIGTEIGGAFKNIIALAAGVADGMGFGNNTKSLIITRGLSEMARFGVALGADVFTFGGLAGIGDLMATCASPLSRNHQVGVRLAKGETLDDIIKSTDQVAEGVTTTQAVYEQAKQLKLNFAIVETVYSILYQGITPPEAMIQLMESPVGTELSRLNF